MLVTDHAPPAVHEKTTPLDEAPSGMIGLETALPLSYALVRENVISERQMVALWSAGPSAVFKLPAASLRPGERADFALFDPDEEWIVGADTLKTKGRNTPLWGRPVRGRVKAHWLAGKRIV
jgi:dihydroorotase